MNLHSKKIWTAIALPVIAVTTSLVAADNKDGRTGQERGVEACQPTPPAPCYSTDCAPACNYCLGPENVAGSPAVRPYTCNGDFVVTVAGLYWNAHQDGLGFGVFNNVTGSVDTPADSRLPNHLVKAKVLNPNFKWDFGWKLGLGYNSSCDGWDFNLVWTHYNGKAHNNVDADSEDNVVALPLWSAYQPMVSGSEGAALQATQINQHWKLKLNMADFELGREFWNSKYLTIRPHIGLRFVWIDQNFKLEHRGLSWSDTVNLGVNYNDFVNMSNDYKGLGIRAGLDTVWNLCRGFAFFGNAAGSLVYGRFSVDQDEYVREASSPFNRTNIMELDNDFRSTKAIVDLTLGIQYSTMFCDCSYRFTIGLGWENHMFFNQNQLWRVNRILGADQSTDFPNNKGENAFIQSRGDLSTQGWTLQAKFEF